jgi:hypothetical protein
MTAIAGGAVVALVGFMVGYYLVAPDLSRIDRMEAAIKTNQDNAQQVAEWINSQTVDLGEGNKITTQQAIQDVVSLIINQQPNEPVSTIE